MAGSRYVVLGLAHARAAWFRDVARWSTSAALPVEFVGCVTLEELRARLASGRAFSAVLVDGALPGVDRDLVDRARSTGCAVLVIDDRRVERDWSALGASLILPGELSRTDLLDALTAYAVPLGRGEARAVPGPRADPGAGGAPGALVAVTGAPGTGTSVLAMALAQGLGAGHERGDRVVLADLALDADQAVLHDAGDVVPGVLELVEAHRGGAPTAAEVRSLTFLVAGRGYSLLLGLRRHRDWAALRPRSVEAGLDGLRRAFRIVVADVDADVEGEVQCGSVDVEDRNVLARTTVSRAGAVVAVGTPGPKGVHALIRVLAALLEHGADPTAIVTVVNRAPRGGRARAEITAAVAELTRGLPGGDRLAGPVFLLDRKGLDDILLDGARLPAALTAPLAAAVDGLLARAPAEPVAPEAAGGPEPVRVAPGSLGSWSDTDFEGEF